MITMPHVLRFSVIGMYCVLAAGDNAAIGKQNTVAESSQIDTVLTKYPSALDVGNQLQDLEAAKPGRVKTILGDFDLSIRTSLILPAPLPTSGPVPIDGFPEATTGYSMTRASAEEAIDHLRNEPRRFSLSSADRQARLEYFERHLDALTVDDHPELALVMMHVLAEGWQDWSSWDPHDERLNRARKVHPDLHRIHALSHLEVLRYEHAVGVLLQVALEDTGELSRRATFALRELGNYEDLLNVYIDAALDPSASDERRWRFWREIMTVTEQRGKAPAYWEPYLDSDVPTLWYCAQIAFDRPLPQDRVNWILDNQGRWNYEHEPDAKVRKRLEYERRLKELQQRKDPETGRISPEDLAEVQALRAMLKEIEKDNTHMEEE